MSSRWRVLISLVAVITSIYIAVVQEPNLGLDLKGGTQVTLDLSPRPGEELDSNAANQTVEILRKRVDSLGVAEPSLEVAGDKRIIVSLPGLEDPEQAVETIGKTAQLTVHPVISAAPQQVTPTTAPTAETNSTATTAPQTTSTTGAGLGASTPSSDVVLGQEAPATTTPTTAVPATTAPTPTTTPGATDGSAAPQQDQTGAITAVDETGTAYNLGPAVVTGDGIAGAEAMPPDPQHSTWYLTVDFKGEGAKAWTKLTAEEACKPQSDISRQSAFVLDGRIIQMSGPASTIQCGVGITGTTTEITGIAKAEEVKEIALLIRGGALPVNVTIASQQVIGPELGQDAIDASILAVLIGGAVTILYILLYYRGLGVLAAVALASYAVISYAVLLLLGLTLTLPGIAGFVLAVAMAMDSNVLVYERTKEEFAAGRSMRQSATLGFKHAFSAIQDSNTTTFLAAATLFFLAIGEVKGFGVTLAIGTAVSIFVTLVILRTLTSALLSLKWAQRHPHLLGLHVGDKFRKAMIENPPNVIKVSKWFMIVSVGLTLLALTGIGVKGINYGIEFSGGRLIEYKTANPVDVDIARDRADDLGFEQAVIQRSDRVNTSVRVKELTKEQGESLDNLMKELGGGTADRAQDTTIGASFGAELKRNAIIGLIVGLALQLAYTAVRFRWTFGVGAVIAMIHDALLVLGFFAWLGKPFDAVFLAALLTIIAFSINDTVVVFDRIREQRRRRTGESFARVVSDACAQTFPRTINISLSALFILLALYFFGGVTLSDFALALVVGVITGIYSSVVIAAPIAVLLERWWPSMSKGMSANTTVSAKRAQRMAEARSASGTEVTTGTTTEVVDESGNPITVRPANRPAPRPRKKGKKR
jgi:SecD/SecF fusion protein